ncbi:hypothetical protein MKZ38_008878 [Zalerion maritima]|uniref:Uncharacterized protein n=1 Tax=Zalerion maritima TaxID=339359 RepID=A0AAD5WTR8_9PEZI|nr:hypothetical protein MKZ38_008878 [Zalerion maritima]
MDGKYTGGQGRRMGSLLMAWVVWHHRNGMDKGQIFAEYQRLFNHIDGNATESTIDNIRNRSGPSTPRLRATNPEYQRCIRTLVSQGYLPPTATANLPQLEAGQVALPNYVCQLGMYDGQPGQHLTVYDRMGPGDRMPFPAGGRVDPPLQPAVPYHPQVAPLARALAPAQQLQGGSGLAGQQVAQHSQAGQDRGLGARSGGNQPAPVVRGRAAQPSPPPPPALAVRGQASPPRGTQQQVQWGLARQASRRAYPVQPAPAQADGDGAVQQSPPGSPPGTIRVHGFLVTGVCHEERQGQMLHHLHHSETARFVGLAAPRPYMQTFQPSSPGRLVRRAIAADEPEFEVMANSQACGCNLPGPHAHHQGHLFVLSWQQYGAFAARVDENHDITDELEDRLATGNY